MALTLKQDNFCLAYIETGNATEAYRRSYNVDTMLPASVNRKAKELMDNVKIASRIEELRAYHMKRHEITIDSLTEELDEAKEVAKQQENAAAMVSATMGKAKLHGLLTDKVKVSGDAENPITLLVASIKGNVLRPNEIK